MFYKTGIVLLLLLIFSCSPKNTTENYYSDRFSENEIVQLVNREPSTDTLQTLLISEAILRAGSPAVTSVCHMLLSDNLELRGRAEFVLAGLGNYVTSTGGGNQRQKFLDGLYTALSSSTDREQKALLISLLYQSGNPGSVDILRPYLNDPDLSSKACRALVTIGSTESGQVLHEQLKNKGAAVADDVIQALGDLVYLAAAEDIFKLAKDEPAEIRSSFLYALARMGYLPAAPLFDQTPSNANLRQNKEITALYLTWLTNLNNAEQLSRGCRKIISDKTGFYDDVSKIAACQTLTSTTGDVAIPDILSLVKENSRKTRLAALEITHALPGEKITLALLGLLETSPPDMQADLIYSLGRREDKLSLKKVVSYLTNKIPEVRAAAVRSSIQLGNEESAPFLLKALAQNTDQADQDLLKTALLELPVSSYMPAMAAGLVNMPSQAKVTGLEIIAERRESVHSNEVLILLQDDSLRVRLAVLNTLALIAGPDQITPLLTYLIESEEASVKKAAAATLSSLAGKIKNQKERPVPFMTIYPSATTENKLLLLSILKKLGGKEAMLFVQKQVETAQSTEEKEAAVRMLVTWPGTEAVDTLVAFATMSRNQTHQILAIRGCIQILGENDLGDLYEMDICKRLLNVAKREEEKQIVLAAMAAVGSEEALKNVARFINDPQIGSAAAKTAMTIASGGQEGALLNSGQVANALISAWPGYKSSDTEETISELPEGFTALFNGFDLSNWKGLVADPVKREKMNNAELSTAQTEADELMTDHWRVIDGILCFDGKGHSICTEKDYKNFELLVDWKIGKDGDSGIYLRGTPQVQMWDPISNPVGSGGLFNNQIGPSIPLRVADNPVGQWNRFRIIMTGRSVMVYLNEKLVVNDVVLENYWERDKPIYPAGQIELQAHNNPLYFRNIYIRELPDEPAPIDGPLFNGTDLSGWEIINKDKSGWKVGDDEILLTEGKGGGWISTTREFADFKLDLEFRLPEGGNSGVFLRTPREGNPAYVGMEIQVLDDYASEYASLKAWQYTGSIYAVLAPAKRVTKKAHEWQHMSIICKGPHINVILNGEMIIDANLIEFMDKTKDHPGLKRRKGYIGLQSHSTKVEYRHIILKEF